MALTSPDIVLIGSIKFGTVNVVETFNSGSSIYNGVNLTYNAQFEITPQVSGWPDSQTNYNTFNANNIAAGWKFNMPSGKIYDVTSVNVYSDTSASINIRDTNLREYINSVQDPPDNTPEEQTYGIFISLINGIPSLSNLTQNAGFFPQASYWTDDILAHSITDLAESGSGGGTGSVTINNNVNDYLITATGTANTLNGESSLRYDGTGLIIGASGSAQSLLQISGSSDLLLIKNGSNNGIKVNNEGVLQFLSQSSTPTVIGGGIYYSGSAFYVGID
jgi:hypothetical protein